MAVTLPPGAHWKKSSWQEVEGVLKGHSIVRESAPLPRGHLRVETAFLYPDGTSIELYLMKEPLRLSDLGQTTAWLLHLQIKPWLSRRRQAVVEDVLRLYGAEQQGGAIEIALSSLDHLIEGIVRLGQACLRVADLSYTKRSPLQSTFSEQIEDFFQDSELPYDPDAELAGRFGPPVRVDYVVHGARLRSLVLGWSSGNSAQAHITANEIFRKWYDLDSPARTEQRVTLLDDRQDVYRPDDQERLRACSTVVALSDRQTVRDLLAA